jgi:hypothetical protein
MMQRREGDGNGVKIGKKEMIVKEKLLYEKRPPIGGLWWAQKDSNLRPSACKADALNQLSYAP